ncbi:MAG: 16S rRNA (guanine(966)-N(2))-methyltransferase RsmD [Cyanobacteria bacterium J06626_14]
MTVRIHGNRPIKTLTGSLTRPTSAKVREAVFNIWQGRVAGCSWLDLCAGSGAMGAEALCRGAYKVVGIEKVAKACSVIQDNWKQIATPSQSIRLIRGDVVQKLTALAGEAFDCIYFDPPYESHLYKPVLEAVLFNGLLTEHGEIAVEHDRQLPLPDNIPIDPLQDTSPHRDTLHPIDRQLACCRRKQYGRTSLTFYRYRSD